MSECRSADCVGDGVGDGLEGFHDDRLGSSSSSPDDVAAVMRGPQHRALDVGGGGAAATASEVEADDVARSHAGSTYSYTSATARAARVLSAASAEFKSSGGVVGRSGVRGGFSPRKKAFQRRDRGSAAAATTTVDRVREQEREQTVGSGGRAELTLDPGRPSVSFDNRPGDSVARCADQARTKATEEAAGMDVSSQRPDERCGVTTRILTRHHVEMETRRKEDDDDMGGSSRWRRTMERKVMRTERSTDFARVVSGRVVAAVDDGDDGDSGGVDPPRMITARKRSPRKTSKSKAAAVMAGARSAGGEGSGGAKSRASTSAAAMGGNGDDAVDISTGFFRATSPRASPPPPQDRNSQSKAEAPDAPRKPRSSEEGGTRAPCLHLPPLLHSESGDDSVSASPGKEHRRAAGLPGAVARSTDMRYYRIAYRGVVALLSEADSQSAKSGAYVSYGEIVSSACELEVPLRGGGPDDDVEAPRLSLVDESEAVEADFGFADEHRPLSPTSPGKSVGTHRSGQTTSTLSSRATSVATGHSSLPLAPSASAQHSIGIAYHGGQHHPHVYTAAQHEEMVTVIRVDDVLTGGYAIDASEDVQQGSQLTPDGGVVCPSGTSSTCGGVGVSSTVSVVSLLTTSDYASFVGQASPGSTEPRSRASNRSAGGGGGRAQSHHGYLFLRRRDVLVAERLAGPPPLCEPGNFLYRVASTSPLPVLAGPRRDAPRTRAVVLPGATHEISLRMCHSFPASEEVVYLRLSHRRGWIADRRVAPGRPNVGGGRGRPRVATLMVEVTGVEAALGDDVSVGSTTVSTASIATPVSVLRRRKPPRRRRRAGAADSGKGNRSFDHSVDEDSTNASRRSARRNPPSTPGSPRRTAATSQGFMSPTSTNVSMLTDDSFDQQQHHGGRTTQRSDQQVFRQKNASCQNAASAGAATSPSRSSRGLKPCFFLMRVTAPRGLKILDAPQFQVNSLIHGQTDHTGRTVVHRGRMDLGGPKSGLSKPPSSIFHTMTGSFGSAGTIRRGDAERQRAADVTPDSSARSAPRILPRGTLFESSRRMEVSSDKSYAPGAGLIKLSDGSGWAIVPTREELDAQYRGYHGGAAGVREGEAARSYEEVGNALPLAVHDDGRVSEAPPLTSPSTLWLRVVHRNGVLVSCAPPPPPSSTRAGEGNSGNASSPTSSTAGSSMVSGVDSSQVGTIPSQESSDVASSVGSSFLEAMMFRSPKKAGRRDGAVLSVAQSHSRDDNASQQKGGQESVVLPCGLCVEVEPWEHTSGLSNHTGRSQSFARLCGGQGWIPLHYLRETYAVMVEPPPEVRVGSFWYRVQSKRGIKVRRGPSRAAHSIKNDEGEYFRFECGEFLRASEVCTIFCLSDNDARDQYNENRQHSSECFAKLYRNSHIQAFQQSQARQSNHRNLESIACPGEWVQVYGNGRLYLDEWMSPPRIERHREGGWRYNAVRETGVRVRQGPSFLSEPTDKILQAGESVLVNERVTGHGEHVTWLRLQDGNGWIHDVCEAGEVVMIAHSLRHRTKDLVSSGSGMAEGESHQGNEGTGNRAVISRLN